MRLRDIAGDQNFKKRVAQMVQRGRIPHAIMYSSREGGGALAFALATATLLVCKNKQDDDACGKCDACLKASHFVHPDIKFYFPSESGSEAESDSGHHQLSAFRQALSMNPYMTGADWKEFLLKELDAKNKQLLIYKNQITQIHRDARLKPMLAPVNVLIIWLPELFHHAAIPKLLKILEEPPEDTIFILASEDQINILPTILSRVQIFRVPPINEMDLLEFLNNRQPMNGKELNKAGEIVNICDGNIAMAIKIMSEGEHTAFFPLFQAWMRACYSMNVPEMLQLIQNLEKLPREKQKNFLLFSLHIFREANNRKKGNHELAKTQPHEAAWLKKFEPALDEIMISDIRDNMEKTTFYLERNAVSRIVFLNLSLDIALAFRQVQQRNRTAA
jgi:DNA polymerase-3 subunit delta'